MALDARLRLSLRRNEARLFSIRVIGMSATAMTAAQPRMQIRASVDAGGPPALDLPMVTDGDVGIYVETLPDASGVPASMLRVLIPKITTGDADIFGYGAIGEVLSVAYGLQWGGVTRLYGEIDILPSAVDSDAAPDDRPFAAAAAAREGVEPGATLTIVDQDVVQLAIDGAGELQVVVTAATEAAARAEVARAATEALTDPLSTDATEVIGRPLGVALVNGQPDQAAQAYFLDRVAHAGTLAAIDIFDRAAGTLQVAVFRGNGGSRMRVGLTTAQTQGGGVSRTIALADPLSVEPGDVISARAAAGGLYTYLETVADGAGYYLGPQQPIPEAVTLGAATTNIVLQIRFRITYREQVVTAERLLDLEAEVKGAARGGSARVALAAAVRPPLLTSASWWGLVGYGQSNSTAYEAKPALSTVQPYANRTFGGGVATSKAGNAYGGVVTAPGMTASKLLVEQDTTDASPGGDGSTMNGETPYTAASSAFVEAAAVRTGIDPKSIVVFASSAGHAGYSIAQLSKGSAWYQSVIDHIGGAAALAGAAGKDYVPPIIYWNQGGDDAKVGNTTAYYLAAFLKLVDDINADGRAAIAAATPGRVAPSTPIHFVLAQIASPYFESTRANLNLIQQAQFLAAQQSPLVHYIAAEFSFDPVPAGQHLTNVSHRRMGAYIGRAMSDLIVDRCVPDCLWPVSAVASGTLLRVRYRVPTLPIVIDEATFGTLPDKGFKVTDGSGVVPILSVGVTKAGDVIEIVLGRVPGDGAVVRQGMDYIGAPNRHLTSSSTCLRDSTTAVSHGQPLWHVAPACEIPIAVIVSDLSSIDAGSASVDGGLVDDLASRQKGKGASLVGIWDGNVQDYANAKARPLTSFGVRAGVLADQSAAINSALDSGEDIYIPRGTFYIGDGIVLPTQAKLTGAGPMRSLFSPLPGATQPVITIAQGQVRYVTLRDFGIQGRPENAGQHGILVRGRPGPGGNGGLWDSLFDNLRMRGFDGPSLAFLGAIVLDNSVPTQFIRLSRLDIERPSATAGPCFYAHGQVEHIELASCRLHGPASAGAVYGGTNVYLGRAFGASGDVVGPLGNGMPLSAVAPKSITFVEPSCENADIGYLLDSVENVTLLGGWHEQIKTHSILGQNSARSITSRNQRFADAATAASGKAVRANSGAQISVVDPRFIGTNTVALSTDGSGSILPVGTGSGGVATENVHWDRTIAAGVKQIDCGVNPGMYIGFAAANTKIEAITSALAPGELFTLKVKPGSAYPGALVTGSGGISNINLGNGIASLALNAGDTVTLRRSQQTHGWDLVSRV